MQAEVSKPYAPAKQPPLFYKPVGNKEPESWVKFHHTIATIKLLSCPKKLYLMWPWYHSRPQRPRSFWSAPRSATSGQVQRHSRRFKWLCNYNRLVPEPIRFVRLDSEHAQSHGNSVNRGLSVLDLARGRDSWCWPKGARRQGTRMPWYPTKYGQTSRTLRPGCWASYKNQSCNHAPLPYLGFAHLP